MPARPKEALFGHFTQFKQNFSWTHKIVVVKNSKFLESNPYSLIRHSLTDLRLSLYATTEEACSKGILPVPGFYG